MSWDAEAFAKHNRGIFQARAIYATQPISSPSYRCRRRKCDGHGYERGGLCNDCVKHDLEVSTARWKRYRDNKREKRKGAA